MLDLSTVPALPVFDWQDIAANKQQDLSVYAGYLNYYGIHFSESLKPEKIKHHLGMQHLGGFDIAVHYFSQPKAKGTVLLTHGYMDHIGLYKHPLKLLLEQGFNVLAYDLPGHGFSSGERAGISNFHLYQKVMSDLMSQASPYLKGPLYAVAQSTGCAIVMDYTLHVKDHKFKKMVLLAPLVIPRKWFGIKAILVLGRYILTQVKRSFHVNSSDEIFRSFLEHKDPLQTRVVKTSWVNALDLWQVHFSAAGVSHVPVMIIQGKADATVQWEYNLPAIQQHFSHYNEVLLDAANHHLVNEIEPLRNKVLLEIKEFLK